MKSRSTSSFRQHINAPRSRVYRALTDADGGTDVLAVHEGLPPGVPAEDNETGWRMSLAKLVALLETP